VCLPFLRYLPWLGDEGILLHGGQRILAGEALYRDFFAMFPPGGFAAVTLWMGVFGGAFVTMRIFAILTIMSIAVLAFHACRAVTGRTLLSAVLTSCWVVASQGDWTVINHHWLTTAYLMAAIYAILRLLEKQSGVITSALVAGLLVGAAGMTTSVR